MNACRRENALQHSIHLLLMSIHTEHDTETRRVCFAPTHISSYMSEFIELIELMSSFHHHRKEKQRKASFHAYFMKAENSFFGEMKNEFRKIQRLETLK